MGKKIKYPVKVCKIFKRKDLSLQYKLNIKRTGFISFMFLDISVAVIFYSR